MNLIYYFSSSYFQIYRLALDKSVLQTGTLSLISCFFFNFHFKFLIWLRFWLFKKSRLFLKEIIIINVSYDSWCQKFSLSNKIGLKITEDTIFKVVCSYFCRMYYNVYLIAVNNKSYLKSNLPYIVQLSS